MNGCNTFVQYIAIGMKYCKNATVLSRTALSSKDNVSLQ